MHKPPPVFPEAFLRDSWWFQLWGQVVGRALRTSEMVAAYRALVAAGPGGAVSRAVE